MSDRMKLVSSAKVANIVRPDVQRLQGAEPSSAARSRAPSYPPVATEAKAYVQASKASQEAMSQMEMVDASMQQNDAADALLNSTAAELASQLEDRGQEAAAKALEKNTAKFFEAIGPAQPYRVDPERGSMASLEDNMDRLDKVMAKLKETADRLGQVNDQPVADNQLALNRYAIGQAIQHEASFAVAYEKASSTDSLEKNERITADALRFLRALPKRVDSQVDSRGGSLEPLERASATSDALKEMIKKFETA